MKLGSMPITTFFCSPSAMATPLAPAGGFHFFLSAALSATSTSYDPSFTSPKSASPVSLAVVLSGSAAPSLDLTLTVSFSMPFLGTSARTQTTTSDVFCLLFSKGAVAAGGASVSSAPPGTWTSASGVLHALSCPVKSRRASPSSTA